MNRQTTWIIGVLVVLLAVSLLAVGYLLGRLGEDKPAARPGGLTPPPARSKAEVLAESRAMLESPDVEKQRQGLLVLANTERQEGMEWARRNLTNPELFSQCITVLVQHENWNGNDIEKAWDAYSRIPDRASRTDVIASALAALKLAGHPKFADVAAEGLASPKREIKGAVLASLGAGISSGVAVPLLIRGLEDPEIAQVARNVLINSHGAPDSGLDVEAWRRWWASEVAKAAPPSPATAQPGAAPEAGSASKAPTSTPPTVPASAPASGALPPPAARPPAP